VKKFLVGIVVAWLYMKSKPVLQEVLLNSIELFGVTDPDERKDIRDRQFGQMRARARKRSTTDFIEYNRVNRQR
jgi:hypothetical protein